MKDMIMNGLPVVSNDTFFAKLKNLFNIFRKDKSNNIVRVHKGDIHLIVDGDFLITSNNNVSIVSKNSMHLDSNEIHLNSRNAPQLINKIDEVVEELNKMKLSLLEEQKENA
jgi:hypothetical protein